MVLDKLKLNYKFNDKALFELALTHSSFCNENNLGASNQRLEFLGDAVLELVTSDILYHKYPSLAEGHLTKLRAATVYEPSLCAIAKEIGLDKAILLGNGEELSGGRERDSIIADALEALIGAIYLDGGFEAAYGFIAANFADRLESNVQRGFEADYKSRLQEIVQKASKNTVSYRIVAEEGPCHDKLFTAEVVSGDEVVGRGIGRSKKDAEQQAASEALRRMGQL